MLTFFEGGGPPGKTGSPLVLTGSAFAQQSLRFAADEKQRLVLDSGAKRAILNCSRQWGKSTVAAAKAVHRAWTLPGALVLLASPTERQTREFMRKAADFVRQMGVLPRGDGDNDISLQFPNGSRMVGIPGKEGNVRGFSAVSLLLIDEAARVPDELYFALRPMLAVQEGDLWLMSTPYGSAGFFWKEWMHGGAEWLRIQAPATECPRISAKFLEEELHAMGRVWFGQEYLCEFVENGRSFFDRESVERALVDEPTLEV